jgi:hypothetical protein
MVATHLLSPRDPSGDLALGQAVAGGRASALFAVLAGVSIALVTGRRTPPRGAGWAAASAGLAVRALLIALVGLLLGELDSGLAVILTYYGVLFLLAIPFLPLRARPLLGLAAAWVVLAPVLSHAVRPDLPAPTLDNPSLHRLGEDPAGLLAELFWTGYYPAVPWLAYLLVGLAVGRLDLGRRHTAVRVALAGAGIALTAWLVSGWATSLTAVGAALLGADADPAHVADLLDQASTGMFGTTPTGGPWAWLLVVAPHTATPFDLAHTIGTALLVVGLALLLAGALARSAVADRTVAIVFGAGTMTLTLYSLHVVARTPGVWPGDTPDDFGAHVALLVATGAAYVALGHRGPLERLVGAVSGSVSGRVSGRPRERG